MNKNSLKRIYAKTHDSFINVFHRYKFNVKYKNTKSYMKHTNKSLYRSRKNSLHLTACGD